MMRKTNRREFLKSHAGAILPETVQENSESLKPETPTVHVTRQAMATEFELQFPDEQGKNFTELALESFEVLESIEEQLSFFRQTS